MFKIPKDINAKPRLLGLEIKELMFFVIAIVLIFTVFDDMIHKIFTIPYYLLAIGTLFYAILPSVNNANRKNYHTFYYLFKKDRTTYKPINLTQEFNEAMEQEVEEFNEPVDSLLTSSMINEYSNEIANAKNKLIERNDKMKDEKYESEEVNDVEESEEKQEERKQPVEPSGNKNNKKGNPFGRMKKWQQGLVSVVGLVLVSLVLMGITTSVSSSSDTDEMTDESNTKQEIFFEEALKSASVKDYSNASVYLDKVNYEELDDEEKNIMLKVYLFSDQPAKAVTNEQSFDLDVANYYEEIEDMDTLNELAGNDNFNTEEFEYKIALHDNDVQRIVDFKDDVKLTDDKKKEIVDAMISLSKFNDAKKFVKDNNMASEHEEKIKNAEKEHKEKEEDKEKDDDKDKEKDD